MARILVAGFHFGPETGGGSRLAYDLLFALAQKGHEVTVLAVAASPAEPEEERRHGVRILKYRMGGGYQGGPFRHRWHIGRSMELLASHVRRPPDVIHGHSLFTYVAALRTFGRTARSCFTVHSPFVEELRINWLGQGPCGWAKLLLGSRVVRRLEVECLQHSDILTAESEYTRTLIRDHYGMETAGRIKVIPGWVDTARFRPQTEQEFRAARDRLGWPLDQRRAFVLRRLERRMGLDNLLRALAMVKRRGQLIHTSIGGVGSRRSRLLSLRDRLGLQQDVTFMGFVPEEILPLAYGACDASVVPTAALECFGIIALEALACGRPTLVTNVGALPEVMQHFEPQWVAGDCSPVAIADLLSLFLAGELPSHPPSELRAAIERTYTFGRALAAYEQALFG